jgi:hypothetical protein
MTSMTGAGFNYCGMSQRQCASTVEVQGYLHTAIENCTSSRFHQLLRFAAELADGEVRACRFCNALCGLGRYWYSHVC